MTFLADQAVTAATAMPPIVNQQKMTGHQAVIAQLLADGLDHMFGNPGTVEEGFLDALRLYPDMKYVLTLQESVAVLAADGYARASGKPALVQIHSAPGLGNAIGALYQANRGHAPLLVIGGDAGIRYQAMDAQMAGDLVAMAKPVTKYATMVQDPRSVLRVLRRALKIAVTPPAGPVYVCLPLDVLDELCSEEVRPTSIPSTRVVPDHSVIETMASWLAAAVRPMLYIGNGVAASGAQEQVAQVAELLGAEVWDVDGGDLNLPYDHPHYQGPTGHMFGAHSKPITERGDVNLICGTYMTPEVFPELGNIFAPDAKTVHIDLNAYEIAKNHPVDLGVVCDPKATLTLLATHLEQMLTPEQRDAAEERSNELAATKMEEERLARRADDCLATTEPLHFAPFARALADALPDDVVIVDEALTNSPPLTRYLPPAKARHYFCTRGGSLGIGFPGAIGAKLAHPDKPVIGISGDGGSMYTIQALWTAARHNLDVKFIVCSNRSYRLLQLNMAAYWQEQGQAAHDFPLSFDLSRPQIGFVELAKGQSVDAIQVVKPSEIGPAIQCALEHTGPFLIDVVLEGDIHPELIGVRCGQ